MRFVKTTNAMVLEAPMERVYPDGLGKVLIYSSGKKDILDLALYRKDGSMILSCRVEAKNYFNPSNIYQPEACRALCEQLAIWANRIDPANETHPVPWSDVKKTGQHLLS